MNREQQGFVFSPASDTALSKTDNTSLWGVPWTIHVCIVRVLCVITLLQGTHQLDLKGSEIHP